MSDAQTIAVYDSALEAYLAVPRLADHLAALETFAELVAPGGTVLDLGSGPGLYAEALMDRGLTVDAIDASETFVAAAKARGVPARVARFEDLPGAATYDGIWASFSLLHAPRDSIAAHVARLAAALTPGAPFFLGMKLGTGESRDDLGRFYSYFSLAELQGMLVAAGLSVLSKQTGNARGLSGAPDSYALFMARRDG